MEINVNQSGRLEFTDKADFVYIKLSPYHREMLYRMTDGFTPKGHDEKQLLNCIRVICHPDNVVA